MRQTIAQQDYFNQGCGYKLPAQHFPINQKTIIRWLDEVIAYFDNGITNGVVEGINNKLKLIKRSDYGFRNFNNFRIRCLLNWNYKYQLSILSTEEPFYLIEKIFFGENMR